MSRVEGKRSRVRSRGLEVEGQKSRVRSRGSEVEGRKSRVASRGSRVASRGSHVEGHSLRVKKSRSRVKSKGSEYKGLYVFHHSKERSILFQTKITFFTGCCLTIAFVFSQQVPAKILRSLE